MNILNRSTNAIIVALLISLAPPTVQSQPTPRPLLAEHPELRELLRKEMGALLDGLQRINIALPQGQWKIVAEQAKEMRDSYILQQSLSADQRRTLHSLLPDGFVRLDKQFHRYAGRLQTAASEQDAELTVHFLARATETCIQCHRRFAPERFPGLLPSSLPQAHDR